MTNPNAGGTIYYTLDGADPRVPNADSPPEDSSGLVPEQAAKRVLIPTSDIGQGWRSQPYDDAGWISGIGGVGYEIDTGFEPYFGIDVGTRMYNVNTTCYVRIPFNLGEGDLQDLSTLTLKVRYDDGFIAYLNGAEVARDRFVGTPLWNSIANGSHADAEAANFVDFDIGAHARLLGPGANLLAIHALNASPMSSDFLISVRLVTDRAQPQADPRISPSAVPYAGPIPLAGTTHVKARILLGDQWSALAETTYIAE